MEKKGVASSGLGEKNPRGLCRFLMGKEVLHKFGGKWCGFFIFGFRDLGREGLGSQEVGDFAK
jgi:hypothetical protein